MAALDGHCLHQAGVTPGDDPELASDLRIEERELKAGAD